MLYHLVERVCLFLSPCLPNNSLILTRITVTVSHMSHSSSNQSLYQQRRRFNQETQDRALNTFLETQGDGSGSSKRKFVYTNSRERSTRLRPNEGGNEGGLGGSQDAETVQRDSGMQDVVSNVCPPSKLPDTSTT